MKEGYYTDDMRKAIEKEKNFQKRSGKGMGNYDYEAFADLVDLDLIKDDENEVLGFDSRSFSNADVEKILNIACKKQKKNCSDYFVLSSAIMKDVRESANSTRKLAEKLLTDGKSINEYAEGLIKECFDLKENIESEDFPMTLEDYLKRNASRFGGENWHVVNYDKSSNKLEFGNIAHIYDFYEIDVEDFSDFDKAERAYGDFISNLDKYNKKIKLSNGDNAEILATYDASGFEYIVNNEEYHDIYMEVFFNKQNPMLSEEDIDKISDFLVDLSEKINIEIKKLEKNLNKYLPSNKRIYSSRID